MSKNTTMQKEIQQIFAENDFCYQKTKDGWFAKVEAIDKQTVKISDRVIVHLDTNKPNHYLVHFEPDQYLDKNIKQKYKYMQTTDKNELVKQQIVNSYYEFVKPQNEYRIHKNNIYILNEYQYNLERAVWKIENNDKITAELLELLQKQKNTAFTEY